MIRAHSMRNGTINRAYTRWRAQGVEQLEAARRDMCADFASLRGGVRKEVSESKPIHKKCSTY